MQEFDWGFEDAIESNLEATLMISREYFPGDWKDVARAAISAGFRRGWIVPGHEDPDFASRYSSMFRPLPGDPDDWSTWIYRNYPSEESPDSVDRFAIIPTAAGRMLDRRYRQAFQSGLIGSSCENIVDGAQITDLAMRSWCTAAGITLPRFEMLDADQQNTVSIEAFAQLTVARVALDTEVRAKHTSDWHNNYTALSTLESFDSHGRLACDAVLGSDMTARIRFPSGVLYPKEDSYGNEGQHDIIRVQISMLLLIARLQHQRLFSRELLELLDWSQDRSHSVHRSILLEALQQLVENGMVEIGDGPDEDPGNNEFTAFPGSPRDWAKWLYESLWVPRHAEKPGPDNYFYLSLTQYGMRAGQHLVNDLLSGSNARDVDLVADEARLVEVLVASWRKFYDNSLMSSRFNFDEYEIKVLIDVALELLILAEDS
ncbi:hypothetical protein [Natronoglycomyces albus]|uniref:Uncharacterized protein n=1 Tax=Natronoglycomyces albus TaxID=2811108 RepID=A0A895XH08_9ACTN|nr:hypothetical protein [Natronoglycomyces albus]QSB04197.1 hypothetical protein JQS30_10270 [Natronoglycomyces albus]